MGRPSPTVFAPAMTPTSALVILDGVTSAAPLGVIVETRARIAPPHEVIFVVREPVGRGKPGPARDDPRMADEGRRGYGFAVEREEMLVSYADGFRYREHELLYGTTDACAELGLEPVVHWDRDEVYILNVWERLG